MSLGDDFEATTEVLGTVPPVKVSSTPQVALVVVTGAEKGAVFPLRPGTFVLGRSAQHSEIVVSGRGLSRAHARVQVDGECKSFVVEDLQSTNGTFLNGERIEKVSFKPGDTLTLGPDVTMLLEASDKSTHALLQEMYLGATQDPLTGLLNRRAFQDRFLEEAAATSRHDLQACLALIDIDHFKSVNDNYGHPAGDAVLVEVARRLTSCLRTEDILARYGGEEFIVLARMTALEGARVLLERMRQVVEATPFPVPTENGEQSLKVTLSAGFTALVKGSTMEQAVERADGALYEAKEKGRNRVVSR